jgi:hypothetical protein
MVNPEAPWPAEVEADLASLVGDHNGFHPAIIRAMARTKTAGVFQLLRDGLVVGTMVLSRMVCRAGQVLHLHALVVHDATFRGWPEILRRALIEVARRNGCVAVRAVTRRDLERLFNAERLESTFILRV